MNQPANMGNMYKYVTISQAVGHWMELTMCGQGYRMISDITISHHIEWSRVISSDSRILKECLELMIWFRFDLRYFDRIDVRNFKDRPQRCQELLAAGAALTVKACEPVAWPHRSRKSHRIGDHRWSPVIIGSNNFHRFPVRFPTGLTFLKQINYVLIIFIYLYIIIFNHVC